MTEIAISNEKEEANHWSFDVEVFDQGRRYQHRVTLSFSDYDHWCRGRVAPSRVVDAAFRFLLSREPASAIMHKFDCAVIRRYFPQVDKELPGLI